MKWVTWENVGVDRMACAWLIRKHIDPKAKFLFVPVGAQPLPTGTEPFDIPGVRLLVRDVVNGRLYNVSSDLHEVGVVWLGQPLVVCDVYEHAFYVDYTNRKQEYVTKFVQFLDWAEIDNRFQTLKS